jgi:hypothetical protein
MIGGLRDMRPAFTIRCRLPLWRLELTVASDRRPQGLERRAAPGRPSTSGNGRQIATGDARDIIGRFTERRALAANQDLLA